MIRVRERPRGPRAAAIAGPGVPGLRPSGREYTVRAPGTRAAGSRFAPLGARSMSTIRRDRHGASRLSAVRPLATICGRATLATRRNRPQAQVSALRYPENQSRTGRMSWGDLKPMRVVLRPTPDHRPDARPRARQRIGRPFVDQLRVVWCPAVRPEQRAHRERVLARDSSANLTPSALSRRASEHAPASSSAADGRHEIWNWTVARHSDASSRPQIDPSLLARAEPHCEQEEVAPRIRPVPRLTTIPYAVHCRTRAIARRRATALERPRPAATSAACGRAFAPRCPRSSVRCSAADWSHPWETART